MIKTAFITLPAICVASLLCGCGHLSRDENVGSMIIEDGCKITITGLSVEQANSLVEQWNIDPDCTISLGKTEDEK